MNGSKAKLMRKLAGGDGSRTSSYSHIEHTIRPKVIRDVLGGILAQVNTATLIINPAKDRGARSLYKTLKQGYKNGAMRPS